MRIAIVSDIHGNLTALEAVLADLRETAPDLILHGGDLPHGGSSPAQIVDLIRDLAWPGVLGNTDEMLFDPQSLQSFAAHSPQLKLMWTMIEEMAQATRDSLGENRLAWLRTLPLTLCHAPLALVHASPASTWRAPNPEAPDADFESTYAALGQPIAAYGHLHRPFIRNLPALTVANTGSVSLSYDGDPRASYLLLDDSTPSIRRVPYDVSKEIEALAASRFPHTAWTIKSLRSARPELP
jgi:predicted phosphodiesterase